MYDGGYDPKNPFPHDGEGKEPCTGYGCDCDEKTMVVTIIVRERICQVKHTGYGSLLL